MASDLVSRHVNDQVSTATNELREELQGTHSLAKAASGSCSKVWGLLTLFFVSIPRKLLIGFCWYLAVKRHLNGVITASSANPSTPALSWFRQSFSLGLIFCFTALCVEKSHRFCTCSRPPSRPRSCLLKLGSAAWKRPWPQLLRRQRSPSLPPRMPRRLPQQPRQRPRHSPAATTYRWSGATAVSDDQ